MSASKTFREFIILPSSCDLFLYTDRYLFPVIFRLMTAGLNQDFLNTRSSLTFVTNIIIAIIKGSVNTTIISNGNITNSRNVECMKHSLKQICLTRYCIGLTTSIIVLRVCRFILWGLFGPENNAEAINRTIFTFQRIFSLLKG